MAEGTYEYECNRAELLGVDPPSRVLWEEAERVRKEQEQADEMTEIDIQDEQINQTTGKVDELTNILSITQMRLNKFKKACGSLTNLLKIRGGEEQSDVAEADANAAPSAEASGNTRAAPSSSGGKTDMQQKMTGQLDKLDMLLTKTENAQYAMQHQTKQMKSFMQ